jgi:peptidoglycan hydrolase-like protein with peptidoglycan-binding domain
MAIDFQINIVSRDSIGLGSEANPFEGFFRVADAVSETVGGEQIRKLPNQTMEQISDIFRDKVVTDTKSGTDAYGANFEPLSKNYKKQKISRGMGGKANLYAKSTSEGAALDNMYVRRKGQSNTVEAGFPSPRQATYMNVHQEGNFPYPKRQFFPDGDAINSANYNEINTQIEELVNQHIISIIERRQRG